MGTTENEYISINNATGKKFVYIPESVSHDLFRNEVELGDMLVFVHTYLHENRTFFCKRMGIKSRHLIKLEMGNDLCVDIPKMIRELSKERFLEAISTGVLNLQTKFTVEPSLDEIVEANLDKFARETAAKIKEKAASHTGLLLSVRYRCAEAYNNTRAAKIKNALSKYLDPNNIIIDYLHDNPVVYYVY